MNIFLEIAGVITGAVIIAGLFFIMEHALGLRDTGY